MSERKFYLSASRNKAFHACSLSYYYKYFLRLPDITYEGTHIGDITHLILEPLANLRHINIYDDIIVRNHIAGSPVVDRYVKFQIRRRKLSEEAYDKINKFVMIALEHDFRREGGKIIGIELDFEIESENPKFAVAGFMDQVIEYPNYIEVLDFKSQSRLFSGEDKENNLQGRIYTFACKELFGYDKRVVVHFQMLNFPEEFDFICEFDNQNIEELKLELAADYKLLHKFDPQTRFMNVAARNGYPTSGEFAGLVKCGYSKRKGHIKPSTGLPYYHCSFKWPFDYYKLCNSDGEVKKTSLKKEDLESISKEGDFILEGSFSGCEHWNK